MIELNRIAYLSNSNVQRFIEWFSANLNTSVFKHGYLNRMSRTSWNCESLYDAYRQYKWPHPAIGRLHVEKGADFDSNETALTALKAELERALKMPLNDEAACQAAIDVMVWGGVQAHNVNWLNTHRTGLAAMLAATRDAIDHGNPESAILLDPALRFNAGMTKVYSLICRNFVIYDSRVAAALGWAVVKYCNENGLATLPPELAFPWAAAKEAGALAPKRRNPGTQTLRFPRLTSGPQHAVWNLRASWLLSAVLESANAKTCGFTPATGLRQMEAALFMLGYDLGETAEGAVPTSDAGEQEPDWIECATAAKRVPFRYRMTAGGFVTEKGKRFPVEVINQTLANLQQQFGSAPFPLANSAEHVPNGDSTYGIGTAYYLAMSKRGNPPDTSQLAAILEDLGIFKLTHDREHWLFNQDLLPTGSGKPIDITPIIQRAIDEDSVG